MRGKLGKRQRQEGRGRGREEEKGKFKLINTLGKKSRKVLKITGRRD